MKLYVRFFTFFLRFFQNPNKTWLFTFFWVVAHVFPNSAVERIPLLYLVLNKYRVDIPTVAGMTQQQANRNTVLMCVTLKDNCKPDSTLTPTRLPTKCNLSCSPMCHIFTKFCENCWSSLFCIILLTGTGRVTVTWGWRTIPVTPAWGPSRVLHTQWRRSQVKSGGEILRRLKGRGLGRGCALHSWGSGGLPPEKKSILRQKLCNSERVLVLLSYITAESGGDYPPVLKVGGPIPLSPPPAPTPMYIPHDTGYALLWAFV